MARGVCRQRDFPKEDLRGNEVLGFDEGKGIIEASDFRAGLWLFRVFGGFGLVVVLWRDMGGSKGSALGSQHLEKKMNRV